MRHRSCCKQDNNDEIGTKGDLKISHARTVEPRKVTENTILCKFLINLLENDSLNGVTLEPKHENTVIDSLEDYFNETHIENNDETKNSLLRSTEYMLNRGDDSTIETINNTSITVEDDDD